jgi:hypothetical protein
VEWSGTALDAISTATLYAPPSAQPGCAATFTTYEDGVRIEVYFSEGSTMTVGKAEVEFQTASTETIRVPLVITKP